MIKDTLSLVRMTQIHVKIIIPQFFAYFITVVSSFLTGAIGKCHPHRYASFDAKNKKE